MSREHRSMTEEAANALENHRKGEESFSQFALRIAAILDDGDNGTTVTDSNGTDTGDKPTLPENVLTEDHLTDIANMTARRTADEVEQRFR